jgi:hypothetical protein
VLPSARPLERECHLGPKQALIRATLFHMPRFEVVISDPIPVVDARVSPGGVSSIRRTACWKDEAANRDVAIQATYRTWDQKYGTGNRPLHPDVTVINLDE